METSIARLSDDELSKLLDQYKVVLKQYAYVYRDTDLPENSPFSHYYRLVYIISGEGRLVCCGQEIPLLPNHVAFLPAHARIKVVNELEVFVLAFEMTYIDRLQAFEDFVSSIFKHSTLVDQEGSYRHLFELIIEEGKNEELGSRIVAENLLRILVIRIMRDHANNINLGKKEQNKLLEKDVYSLALEYINEHLDESIKINQMAEEVGVSSNYLYKVFQAKTGKSLSDFIIDTKMDMAKHYLENPVLSIKTIALELGYSTASYFSESFKKHEGISPLEYRKTHI